MFLKNRNIISKIRRSKVTDYAAFRDIMALDLGQNFVSTQYLKNEWMEFKTKIVYALILTRKC